MNFKELNEKIMSKMEELNHKRDEYWAAIQKATTEEQTARQLALEAYELENVEAYNKARGEEAQARETKGYYILKRRDLEAGVKTMLGDELAQARELIHKARYTASVEALKACEKILQIKADYENMLATENEIFRANGICKEVAPLDCKAFNIYIPFHNCVKNYVEVNAPENCCGVYVNHRTICKYFRVLEALTLPIDNFATDSEGNIDIQSFYNWLISKHIKTDRTLEEALQHFSEVTTNS